MLFRSEFALANNGIAGFETAFALSFTYLVKEEGLPINKLIMLMSCAPSDLLKLGRGNLGTGSPADISVFDVDTEYVFKKDMTSSKAKNTPFDGWKLFGKSFCTIVGGNIVYG